MTTEELREDTTPAAGAGVSTEQARPSDASGLSLSRLKTMVKNMMEGKVERAYKAYKMDITHEEVNSITVLCCEMGAVDVMEVYSPKRFTGEAARFGLKPGYAIDLEEQKPDESYWALLSPEDVKQVEALIDKNQPILLTGSPPCDQFRQQVQDQS